METQFTQEDLKNMLALINLAPIKGQEAVTVAILQQKIAKLIELPKEEPKETKEETK
jgi:hypothetical protein